MNLINTIAYSLSVFAGGFVAAWLSFDHFVFQPYRKRAKKLLKAAESALLAAALIATQKPKGEDGLILSPFQVNRFGLDGE